MKLKVRYENEIQVIELNDAQTEQLCVSLSVEVSEELTPEEQHRIIQNEYDKQYNIPEYNNWHKHNRHRGYSSYRVDSCGNPDTNPEPLICEVFDDSIFHRDEIAMENELQYEEWCKRIRAKMKPGYAEMLIAIHLDGMKPGEYAKSIGISPNTLSHRLKRAEKKFKEVFPITSFFTSSQGYITGDKSQ